MYSNMSGGLPSYLTRYGWIDSIYFLSVINFFLTVRELFIKTFIAFILIMCLLLTVKYTTMYQTSRTYLYVKKDV